MEYYVTDKINDPEIFIGPGRYVCISVNFLGSGVCVCMCVCVCIVRNRKRYTTFI